MKIAIKVKAGAKKDEIISYEKQDDGDYILKLSVKQVPENGKANEAVIKLLAKEFRMRREDIQIVSGARSSTKLVTMAKSSNSLDINSKLNNIEQ